MRVAYTARRFAVLFALAVDATELCGEGDDPLCDWVFLLRGGRMVRLTDCPADAVDERSWGEPC